MEFEDYFRIAKALAFSNSSLAFIGILLNSLVFTVFQRKRFKNCSFSFYFQVMVITDNCALLHTYRDFVTFIWEYQIDRHHFFCHFTEYSKIVCASISLWLLALIGFDRMRSIVISTHLIILKARKSQIILILIITIGSLCLFSPLPLFIYYTEPDSSVYGDEPTVQGFCVIDPSNYLIIFLVSLSNWIICGLVLNNLLSIIMIVFIFRSRKRNNGLDGAIVSRQIVKDRKFAINSITLNLASLLLKLPYLFAYIVF